MSSTFSLTIYPLITCRPTIDMLSLPLHSTRGKLIAEIVFRLNP